MGSSVRLPAITASGVKMAMRSRARTGRCPGRSRTVRSDASSASRDPGPSGNSSDIERQQARPHWRRPLSRLRPTSCAGSGRLCRTARAAGPTRQPLPRGAAKPLEIEKNHVEPSRSGPLRPLFIKAQHEGWRALIPRPFCFGEGVCEPDGQQEPSNARVTLPNAAPRVIRIGTCGVSARRHFTPPVLGRRQRPLFRHRTAVAQRSRCARGRPRRDGGRPSASRHAHAACAR